MLHLTPEMLVAAYNLLKVTPPFRRLKLPPADSVEFHVTRHRAVFGDCEKNPHVIRVSAYKNTTLDLLLTTMAHEMLHLVHHNHGSRWQKLASSVCRKHGWERYGF